jgi:hypothetical protein
MVGATAKPTGPPPQPVQKSRPNPPPRETGSSKRSGRPAAWIRVFVSLLLVWHLAAVALAPMSLPPSSNIVVDIAQQPPMQWYLDLLYLNHGYHFFAPDPGPGHLVRYEVFDARGGVIAQGEFPDPKVHWPRLYYHRYFMLADQAGLPSDDEQYRKLWQRKYLEAYARQLLREHDGESIRLRWIIHYSLPPLLAQQGRKLTDPESYETEMEVTQRRSDLGPPPGMPDAAQGGMWHGGRIEAAGLRPQSGRWVGGVR